MFPTPQELGLSAKFTVWRPNQPQAIKDALKCKKRVKLQAQDPGAGKSVSNVAVGLMKPNSRTLILTVNKSLQDQYMDDFAEIGMVDIRGKSSYDCQGRPGHNCEAGSLAKCAFKGSSICPWSSAKQAAAEARLVVSNYSCVLASNKYGNGLGKFDTLVLDEGHEAPDQLAKAMQILVGESDMELLKYDWPDHRQRKDMKDWKHWGLVGGKIAAQRVAECQAVIDKAEGSPKRADVDRLRQYKNLDRKLADIAMAKADNWVVAEWRYGHGYQFDPIDAGVYAERMLLSKTPNVIVSSGTLHSRVPDGLGLTEDDYELFTYVNPKGPSRSPIYYIPAMKVDRYAQEWQVRKYLVGAIDDIIESRIDRKGVIHTCNFQLRDLIYKHSRFQKYMESNWGNNGTTGQLISKFRGMDAPAWFISPSIGTGIDLPHDACRVQIIAKMPFENANSEVEKARVALDPLRGIARMWQRFAQQVGRADRADDDWQEVFVLDSLFNWLSWKHGDLAAIGLLTQVRPVSELPEAPEMES